MKPKKIRNRRSRRPFFKKTIIAVVLLVVLVIFFNLFRVGIGYFKVAQVSPLPIEFGDLNLNKIMVNQDVGSQIKSELKKNNIEYLSVNRGPNDSYIIILEQDSEVIVKSVNIESQISSLQKIINRLTMEGKKIKSLDLRYNKPVIVLY